MQTREPTLGVQRPKQLCLNAGQSSRRSLAAGLSLSFTHSSFFFFFLPPPDITGACCFHRNFWLGSLYSKFIFFNTCYIPPSACTISHSTPAAKSKKHILGFEKLPHSPLGWQEQVNPLLLNALVFFPFFLFLFLSFLLRDFFWCISKSRHLKRQPIRTFLFSWKALSQPDLSHPEGQGSRVQL